MRKYLIPLIILVPVGLFSYMYNLMSFLLLAVIALSLVVLLMVGVFKIFRNSSNAKWVRVPLVTIVICVIGIVVGLFRPLEPAIVSSGSASDKLAYAYKTDQADRMTIRTYLGMFKDNMVIRDSIRLEQVNQLYRENQVSLPLDKLHAAFIFHHGKEKSLFEIAHKLANEAASESKLKNDYVVQWLAKATYDRWMISLGKPQKYGTQEKFSVSVD